MRVLCCALEGQVHPDTVTALSQCFPGHELVFLPAGDPHAYWTMIMGRWGSDDLVIIEQDIVIHDQVVPQFQACPQPWCAFDHFPYYTLAPADFKVIGCVRYRAEVQRDIDPGRYLALFPGGKHDADDECTTRKICWRHVDQALAWTVGGQPHLHEKQDPSYRGQAPVRHLRGWWHDNGS